MSIDWKDYRLMALELLKTSYLPIWGEFNQEMEDILVECLTQAQIRKKKKIILLINSQGGWNKTYSALKGMMAGTGIEFTGIVVGQALSNAFNLLQLCAKRKAVPDATLMFHWGQQRLSNSELAALIAGETWPIQRATQAELLTADVVSQRTGIPVEELKVWALHERSFLADEALRHNLIDEVLPHLPQHLVNKLKMV
jgi:ATP-dependent protease ClpP protease subunit